AAAIRHEPARGIQPFQVPRLAGQKPDNPARLTQHRRQRPPSQAGNLNELATARSTPPARYRADFRQGLHYEISVQRY
ncbi:hypothetical protein RA267_30010, partial [Pseudomonas syringae pv. tagetis]